LAIESENSKVPIYGQLKDKPGIRLIARTLRLDPGEKENSRKSSDRIKSSSNFKVDDFYLI